MINRCAVTISAKEPSLGWLLSLPGYDDITLDEVIQKTTTYLLSVYANDTEKDALIEQCFGLLFEEELAGWWMAKDDWPKGCSLTIFKSWFNVDFHSVVVDLEDAPLRGEK